MITRADVQRVVDAFILEETLYWWEHPIEDEDAQQRARGRLIRNITHTNTVTTVYEDGGGRPSVRRTSTRTSSPSPPRPPRRGRDRGRGRARGRGRRS